MTTLAELELQIDQRLDWVDLLNVVGVYVLIANLAEHLKECVTIPLGGGDNAASVQRVVPCLLRVLAKISERLASIDSEITWTERQELTSVINRLTFGFERIAEK